MTDEPGQSERQSYARQLTLSLIAAALIVVLVTALVIARLPLDQYPREQEGGGRYEQTEGRRDGDNSGSGSD